MDIPNVIIVNNQTSERFTNKQLSGAGVVYKVIQAYDMTYGDGTIYKKYEDLAALGIVADCMDCRTLDNNAIINNGLANIHNDMFKAFLIKQSGGGIRIKDIENPTKIDLAFYIAPLINAVIRSGSIEEKTQLFEGFINIGNDHLYESKWRGVAREETLYEFIARTATNLRGKQNRAKEKSIESLVEQINNEHLDQNSVIILKVGAQSVNKNITGLVAMDIVNRYSKPTLVLRPVVVIDNGIKRVYYRGSGRAPIVPGFDNFMAVLHKSGLMEYVEGHENAFGASVLEENIPPLTAFLNQELANIKFAATQIVDCCMIDSNWNNLVLKEFGQITRIYGNGIPEPKFHFEFDAHNYDFKIQGSKFDSLKIQHNGITFIAFSSGELVARFTELATSHDNIHVELIGSPSINHWNGYDNVQVMIREIEMTALETHGSGTLF